MYNKSSIHSNSRSDKNFFIKSIKIYSNATIAGISSFFMILSSIYVSVSQLLNMSHRNQSLTNKINDFLKISNFIMLEQKNINKNKRLIYQNAFFDNYNGVLRSSIKLICMVINLTMVRFCISIYKDILSQILYIRKILYWSICKSILPIILFCIFLKHNFYF